jgi:hypothetical protein
MVAVRWIALPLPWLQLYLQPNLPQSRIRRMLVRTRQLTLVELLWLVVEVVQHSHAYQ